MLHPFTRLVCECCGESRIVPVYCGNRFCPICQGGRLARIRARLDWLVEKAKSTSTSDFRHLTLTITSQESLRTMIDHLLRAFKKLRSKRLWKSSVTGGAYVVEITGGYNNWHAHLHIIIQGSFIGWRQLRDLWLKLSGSPGCYIQRIPARAITLYLTKYLTKAELPETDLPFANQALANLRLFNPFGKWHSISQTYVKPVHPCRECGRTGTWTTYACLFGGPFVELLDPNDVARMNTNQRAPAAIPVEAPILDEPAPF